MRQLTVFLSVLVAATMFCGCGGKKKAAMPPELPALAQEFKSTAAGTAKIELGKKIMTLLPTCTRPGADGTMVTIDYENPTYVLKIRELQALLGQPSESTPEFVSYKLGEKAAKKDEKRDGKHTTQKTATFHLLVDVYDDYVSSARIDIGQ